MKSRVASGFLVAAAVAAVLIQGCGTTKSIEYNMFGGLTPENEKEMLASAERGSHLYKANCSDCHGIYGRGKKGITNFSQEELHSYENSFLAGDEDNHAVIFELSSQELQDILLFLTLLKRE